MSLGTKTVEAKPQSRMDREKPSRRRQANASRINRPIEDEIAHLRGLALKGLQARWRSETGATAPAHLPKHLLFAMLAYRLQADALGDLDQATLRLLAKAGISKTREAVQAAAAEHDQRQRDLPPGAILTRQWNDKVYRVMVLESGFAFDGRSYDSLSAIAHAITGTRWNGPRFFGLRDKPPRKDRPEQDARTENPSKLGAVGSGSKSGKPSLKGKGIRSSGHCAEPGTGHHPSHAAKHGAKHNSNHSIT